MKPETHYPDGHNVGEGMVPTKEELAFEKQVRAERAEPDYADLRKVPICAVKNDWIDLVVRDISELPYRFPPDDMPDFLLVTPAELRTFIEHHLALEKSRHEKPLSEKRLAGTKD